MRFSSANLTKFYSLEFQTTQDFQEQGFYASQLAAKMASILWAAHPFGKLECSPLHSWLTNKPLCPPGPPSFCLQVYDTQAFC